MKKDQGFTLTELLVAIGILSVLSATAVYNLKQMNSPLNNAASSIEHFLHLSRARAISGTQVVEVKATSVRELVASTGTSCSGALTVAADQFLELPSGASLSDITTKVCFTQRGLAAESATFNVTDADGKSANVKVALGGGTMVE